MTYAMTTQASSPLHRQTGFHINAAATSPRTATTADIASAFPAPPSAGFINPMMTMHSPEVRSPAQNLFDLSGTAHSFSELDLLGHSLNGQQQQQQRYQGGDEGGEGGHFIYSPPIAQPRAIPPYFSPTSAAPSDIFSHTPDTIAGSYSSTIAEDLASIASPTTHRRTLSSSSSTAGQPASGKAPRGSVSARSARRFTVSGAGSPTTIKAEVATPSRWFDQPPTPVDIAITPSHPHYLGGQSAPGSGGGWLHSPAPVGIVDRGGGAMGHQGQGGFMPASAPATSTSFALGRVPPSRLRSESQLPTLGTLSDVGEEVDQNYGQKASPTDKRKKRRESHNAVERRRRDHINQAISDLSHLIPTMLLEPTPGAKNLTHHHVHGTNGTIANSPTFTIDDFNSPSTSGALLKPNKGLILERSVDYIRLLQQQVATLTTTCSALKDTVTRLGGDPIVAMHAQQPRYDGGRGVPIVATGNHPQDGSSTGEVSDGYDHDSMEA